MNPILEAAVAKGFMTPDQASEAKARKPSAVRRARTPAAAETAALAIVTKQEPNKAGGALVAELAFFALQVAIVTTFGPAGIFIAALGVAASSKPRPRYRRRRRSV